MAKDLNNSSLYKCPREHPDMRHFVGPKAGTKSEPGDAEYGKPMNGTWKPGGGKYEEHDAD